MKRKIIKLLARIRRSKFFKIFFSSLVVISVLICSFVIPSSAEDSYVLSGRRLFFSDLDIGDDVDLIYVNPGNNPEFVVNFVSNGSSFAGYLFRDSSSGGPILSGGVIVYTSGQWVDQEYRSVDFGSSQSVSASVYSFITSSSIAGAPPLNYPLSGIRIFNSSLDLTLPGLNGDTITFSGLKFVTGGSGYVTLPFVSNRTWYQGFAFYDPSFIGPSLTNGDLVYESGVGWINDSYRVVDFGDIVYIQDWDLFNWILQNSVVPEFASYEDGYIKGLEDGFDEGYNSGYDAGLDAGYDNGYDTGYSIGLLDGLNSTDSGNLGENLIGSTLSAPFRALDNFILFSTPGGVDISLGFIFGGIIALIIFLAFLKMFAGG